MLADVVGALALGVWAYLLFLRGFFWELQFPEWPAPQKKPQERSVAVIVPARNEADVVRQTVRSLVEQHYPGHPGRLHVFVVDDASSDDTAAIARQAAEQAGKADRLTVVPASPLPAGWTGKVWALSEGVRIAASFHADYFLFSDADIVHPSDQAARLIAHAEAGNFDLVSLMVKLSCKSFAERALIPAFVFFFLMLYPPAWVAAPNRRTAAAAGGCVLIRAGALARIGGLEAIRNEIIDDCALAHAVKQGGRIWLGVATDTESLRPYESWGQIAEMISRTAFTQLGHSLLLLAATVAGMTLTYLAPPLLLFFARQSLVAALGTMAWVLMTYAFWPTLRYYRRSPLWAPLLPLVATFYVGATVHSAVRYWRGHGGLWKDRVQDPIHS